MAAYCPDYPCCGHTPQDPCWREWYDEPGAFDTSILGHEHRLCDHENGECDVPEPYDDDDEDLLDAINDDDDDDGEWDSDYAYDLAREAQGD